MLPCRMCKVHHLHTNNYMFVFITHLSDLQTKTYNTCSVQRPCVPNSNDVSGSFHLTAVAVEKLPPQVNKILRLDVFVYWGQMPIFWLSSSSSSDFWSSIFIQNRHKEWSLHINIGGLCWAAEWRATSVIARITCPLAVLGHEYLGGWRAIAILSPVRTAC